MKVTPQYISIFIASHTEIPVSTALHICISPDSGTDRLQRLEETVEDQVPDDLPMLHRRNVPDQEVARHCKGRGQEDPGEVGVKGHSDRTSDVCMA